MARGEKDRILTSTAIWLAGAFLFGIVQSATAAQASVWKTADDSPPATGVAMVPVRIYLRLPTLRDLLSFRKSRAFESQKPYRCM